MAENSNPPFPLAEPVTESVRTLRSRLSLERWLHVASEAVRHADILEAVKKKHKREGLSLRRSLAAVAPEIRWPRYLHWCKLAALHSGPLWERLIDRRVPPEPKRVSAEVRRAAVDLRREDPSIGYSAARRRLVKDLGKDGNISNSSLGRIWSAAGLTGVAPSRRRGKRYDGGAGFAFLVAAEAETNAVLNLANAALEAGWQAARDQGEVAEFVEPEGRDDRGRLTGAYNRSVRAGLAPGDVDYRFEPDAKKRAVRDLSCLATLQNAPRTLARKLFAMGVYPLLSERRGFDGLDGPCGEWLGILGGVAYMAATLDKCLAQLALLNVVDALWRTHARNWYHMTLQWLDGREGSALQVVVYVDATKDPYWTRRFALSGKVERVGRVMPCLSRVAVMVGPGVPLYIDTQVGTVSMKTALLPTVERVERMIGNEEVERVTVIEATPTPAAMPSTACSETVGQRATADPSGPPPPPTASETAHVQPVMVVDAEMATAKLLMALEDKDKKTGIPKRLFVTVWKGSLENFKPMGSWEPFRKTDRLREGTLRIKGEGAPPEGVEYRAVEMQRTGSRHPKSTVYLTNGTTKDMSTQGTAELYLSRWPNQEQDFRDGRNGGGLERSHGYTGEYVQHVALESALEKSERRVKQAESAKRDADANLARLQEIKKTSEGDDADDGFKRLINAATRAQKAAEKNLEKAHKQHQEKLSTPKMIYKRDTTRENISTALTATVVVLIEFVMRQYFRGVKIQFRTFIEHLIALPVTVFESRTRITFRIEVSNRNPERADQVRRACADITRRRLRYDDKLLVYEAVDPPGQ